MRYAYEVTLWLLVGAIAGPMVGALARPLVRRALTRRPVVRDRR